MKILAAFLLVCTLIALSAGGQPPAAGPNAIVRLVPQNIDMSQMSGNEAETAVAISHTDPRLITSVSNLEYPINALFHSWSTDAGHTWQHDVIATGSDSLITACCDAQLASDDYGNIFLTYLSSRFAVTMAISIDGGATFQQLAFLTSLPSGLPVYPWKSLANIGQTVSGDQPSISAGVGSVWISWTAYDGTIQASGAPVTGLGQVGTFTPVQGIGNRHGDYGDTAIGPNGEVFVTYQNPTGGEGPAMIYGALDPDGLGPQRFGAAKVIQTTNVGGFDYIPAQSGRSIDAEAGLAWDRTGGPHNGRLYFVYVSEEPEESNDTDIQFRYSDDDGTTWTNAVRLNDDSGTNSQFNPKISLDSTSGNIAIAWYDARNDLGDNGRGDTNGLPNDDIFIYYTLSKDGGLTFQRNRRLSAGASNDNDANSGVDYGDYSGFDFHAGAMYFSAADNSNSTGDNPDGTLNTFDLVVAPLTVR